MPKTPSIRSLSRLLPVLLLTVAPAALAQSPYGATVEQLPKADDPAELLAQALRTLAVEPNNLAALTTAGHNALVLGDPNAAVGFFGRAQEIAPRDGHVKAGLGSALVELEKPQEALRLFAEASRLGVPDEEIAQDRGLAYDLTGDPRRAQRDYAIVLAAHPDDDAVRRRLALSQGISGDKAAAIATLDPLIRKRDIAGWRAQTFVLAMNGDAKGASSITHIMLPQQADMLQPFLVRLATLSPADKARAVNFGEMPAAGRAYTPTELANTGGTPTYAAPSRAASAKTPTTIPTAERATQPPRVVARSSDLAPITASPARPAATPATMAAPQTTAPNAAPLAAIASTPAATQIVSTRTPAPQPVQVAQAAPATPSVVPISDLPTPAAAGHYDLPHDSNVHTSSRPEPAPAPATMQTIGAPVVHGEAGKPEPKPVKAKPQLAENETASRSTPKPAIDESDSGSTKHKSANDDGETTKSRKGAYEKPASVDETDKSSPSQKDRKFAHGKISGSDESDDQASSKTRKGAHSKSTSDDETDTVSKTRKGTHGKSGSDDETDSGTKSHKGAHGAKSTSNDDSDDTGSKSHKSTHGKKSSDDDSDAKSSKSKKSADKADPERVFVQVAGGANKDDMDKAWSSVKKKAPELMKGRNPQTMPIHATNRLMVGPFKSENEAQAFVNKMAGKGLSGFTVKTGKGQKVDKVDSGQ